MGSAFPFGATISSGLKILTRLSGMDSPCGKAWLYDRSACSFSFAPMSVGEVTHTSWADAGSAAKSAAAKRVLRMLGFMSVSFMRQGWENAAARLCKTRTGVRREGVAAFRLPSVKIYGFAV